MNMTTTIITSAIVTDQRLLHVVRRWRGWCRSVGEDGDLDARGHPALQLGHQRADLLHRLDDVRIGLLGDGDHHRGLAVEPGRRSACRARLPPPAPPRTGAMVLPSGCAPRVAEFRRRRERSLMPSDQACSARPWRPRAERVRCWRWWCGWPPGSAPIAASWLGLTATRMAGCSAPLTLHLGDARRPARCAARCTDVRHVVDRARPAASARSSPGSSPARRPGWPCGRAAASAGRWAGRRPAAFSAACTSRAALSMLREGRTGCRCPPPQRARRGHLGDAGNGAEPAFQRRGDRGRHGHGVRAGPARRDVDGRHLDTGSGATGRKR